MRSILLYGMFLFGFWAISMAQEKPTIKEIIKGNKDLIVGIDNRRTHVNDDFIPIYGAYVGLRSEYNFRIKLSLSGTPFNAVSTFGSDATRTSSRLFFASIGEEYDFFRRENFRLVAYGQLGLGQHFFNKYLLNGQSEVFGKEYIMPLELGLIGKFYIRSWCSINAGFGWRWVFLNEYADLENYFFKLGIGVDIAKFYPKNWNGARALWQTP